VDGSTRRIVLGDGRRVFRLARRYSRSCPDQEEACDGKAGRDQDGDEWHHSAEPAWSSVRRIRSCCHDTLRRLSNGAPTPEFRLLRGQRKTPPPSQKGRGWIPRHVHMGSVWKHHAPCFNTSGRPQFPEVVAGRGGPSAQCRNAIGTGGLPTSARRFLSRGTALPFESWPAKGVR
jgi:hypothetical protein